MTNLQMFHIRYILAPSAYFDGRLKNLFRRNINSLQGYSLATAVRVL